MRRFLACLLFLFLSGPAYADQRSTDLPDLFEKLRNGQDDPTAVQRDIEDIWATAPEMGIQLLFGRAALAIERGDTASAQILSGHITSLAPSFAEGWMIRGHSSAMAARDGEAAEAFAQALALEPRHFNAMVALGDLALLEDDKAMAFDWYRRALDLNPHLGAVREQADKLRRDVFGQEI